MEYRNPRPYRDQDVLVVGAGNSGTEIAIDLAEGGAARVRIAVRTPPNILRRDVKGFPIQLLGIVSGGCRPGCWTYSLLGCNERPSQT